ncbi:Zinc finger, CCCH-type [Phytophthora cactorum]|nr:Zinc finger, CCCH-type [Phytophthora cactorum]
MLQLLFHFCLRSRRQRERVFESLQRQLATQNLNDRSSEAAVTTRRNAAFHRPGVGSSSTNHSALPRCTFSHSLPAQVSECAADETEGLSAAAALVDCPFFLRGNCKYGEHCRLRHNPAMLPGASIAASARSAPRMGGFQPRTALLPVLSIQGQRLLLTAITASAWIACARGVSRRIWELEVIRACPACRLPSDFIVPSLIFVTGEEKRKVVEAYKSHLALRECKYFNGLFGSCPFGPRCFYAHRDSEGRDVKHLDRPKRSTNNTATCFASLKLRTGTISIWSVACTTSDDSDDDYFEYGFSDDDYDTE